jgi:ABC-2 type transport system permease protein
MTTTTPTTTPTTPVTPTEESPTRRGTSRSWWLVARREVAVKLTDRAFLVGTVLTVLLIAGVLGLQGYLENRTSTYTVATTDPSAAAMVDRVVKGAHDVDAWLRPSDDGWTLVTRKEAPEDLRTVVSTVVREAALGENATQAGTTVEALERGTAVEPEQLDGNAERTALVGVLGFAFAFLFYLASVLFGMALAGSVVEEKQSRIVEMIAAAIPLRQLLAGKVVGNTLMAFGQMAVFVGVGLVGLSFTDYGRYIPSISGSVGWFLGFFVLGFVALACLWAVAGALASRTEDLQSTSAPITTLMLLMYFGALFLAGTARAVVSFVPPVSSILMPMRLLEGEASWWEPVVALVLLVGFAALLVALGERIYRRALLQTGGKVSLRQAWGSGD